MAISTWYGITTCMHAAIYKSYARKSKRQKSKVEVKQVWDNLDSVSLDLQNKLESIATFICVTKRRKEMCQYYLLLIVACRMM